MKTNLLYMTDSYIQETQAVVQDILSEENLSAILLDQTIFYAQGGGQPADQGEIIGSTGKFTVSHVSYNGGEVLHKGKLMGTIRKGETVTLKLNWTLRYQHMQQHTTGHIVDQAVKNVLTTARSVDGNHGIGKHMYIEFATPISKELLPQIQTETNKIVAANLPTVTEMVNYSELVKRHVTLPPDLPQNKQLRLVQIGQYPEMPDGGTQLKTTGESWPITITQVIEKDGNYRVVYVLQNPGQSQTAAPLQQATKTAANATESKNLSYLTSKITEVQAEFGNDLANPTFATTDLKTKYLGKKGAFNTLAQVLRELDPAVKKDAGQLLNTLKTAFETKLGKREQTAANTTTWVDLTMPGTKPKVGHMHPVSQAMEEITHIFEQIGFTRVRYPEVDWDHYVFESLNMPPDHPARDEWETFFVDAPISKSMGKMVLTTHTSNGQVREMERLGSQPPIRMINIARCYRRQQDATHTQMFHQFEGLVVDKGINIQHLKGTLDYFAEKFYGPGTKSRIRPFHFRFTEPSFEVDFSCHICHGTGKVNGTKCKFCKSGWHEVGGAGMVHPNVLKAGGIDSEKYTGFAFGWGIERTYTLKQGLNIDDIRLLYSGDARFLAQF
jgi:phenylalanyl-tRNA synthetase alpha chain